MIRFVATWTAAAVISAVAAGVVARQATPIDAALPFITVVITAIAAVSHPAVMLAVPLLIGGEIALAAEKQRLLWFGVVVGAAFAVAIVSRVRPGEDPRAPEASAKASLLIAVAAVLLLRWIPLSEVLVGREVVILLLAAATVFVLKGTPAAVAVAVISALFTPGVPLRTLAVPAAVLLLAVAARFLGAARLRLPVASATAVAAVMLFFAWSGAFARAVPIMLRGGPPQLARAPVAVAIAAGESAEIDVPPNGRGLILSGANMPRLRRGTLVGRIEPGGIEVRVGDIADWGVLRREHHYDSRNPLPRRPGGLVRGYGQTSWIDASGRVPVAPGRVVVTADRSLPPRVMLQIDAIELAE